MEGSAVWAGRIVGSAAVASIIAGRNFRIASSGGSVNSCANVVVVVVSLFPLLPLCFAFSTDSND